MRWQWVLRVAALVFLGICLSLGLTRTWTHFNDYRHDPLTTGQTGCNTVFDRWTGSAGYPVTSPYTVVHDSIVSANVACTAAIDQQQEWVIAIGAVAVGLFISSFLVRRPAIAEATRQPSHAAPDTGEPDA